MAQLKKVADVKTRGSSFLPGPGGGVKIPSGTAAATPKPKAAPNSGKTGKFPAPTNGQTIPLRSNGKSGTPLPVGSALSLVTKVSPVPLRSGK